MLKSLKKSLAKSTLLSIGLRISLVVMITAFLSYHHIIENLEHQTLDKLEQYIKERTQKESAVFKLAAENHLIFKDRFSELWTQRKNSNPKARYLELFKQHNDATSRTVDTTFTGIARPHSSNNDYVGQTKWISGFIGQDAPIDTTEFQNKVLLAYDLIDHFAEGWSHRFANTYVTLPEGANIVYWPHLNWADRAAADLDIQNEEWFYISTLTNNPKRESQWTGLYFDESAEEWLVSCITPVDDKNGRHLINIGHDILLNDLFKGVFEDHLEGAYNFIIRLDGRIIAHPFHTEELQKNKGLLSALTLPDEDVFSQYTSIIDSMESHDNEPLIIEHKESDSFIAFDHIDGADSLFVTVYPKSLLSSPAKDTAIFILFLGLISLVIELLLLYRVLAKKVMTPMQQFKTASELISDGKYQLDPILSATKHRQDEVGQLSKAFLSMANRINNHSNELESKITERTQELEDAKQYAELQARTDILTDLPNRRAFFEVGTYAFKNAKRNIGPLSIIMLDIDKFKRINDTYGHAIGDIVLQNFSSILSSSIRPSDICARLGGEEFAVLASNTDLSGAVTVAEKIRQNIEDHVVQIKDTEIKFTVSCGVANISSEHYELEDLLKDADMALYEAKGNGRNRVISKNNT